MIRAWIWALGPAALSAAIVPLPAFAGCTGADPAITSVVVRNVGGSGLLKSYTIGGIVTNVGNRAQASNVLQFVDIYEAGEKRSDLGIPPLRPAGSYAFSYVWRRAADAGPNTTTLDFRIRMRQPTLPTSQDCNTGNDAGSITF